ncbi:MAG: MMPL family transporter [Myxococcales bacterium]|nr:MAG: MMPL family transporter [Myxococcales bacterium]
MRQRLIDFALNRPRIVFTFVVVATLGLASFIPKIHIDTDPENMLSPEEPARIFHDHAKKEFALHDMLVVGVVNSKDPDGVFNPKSLKKIHKLNEAVKTIDGVIAEDVVGLSTVDNIEQEGPGTIRFEWLMREVPTDRAAALAVRDAALRLPSLRGTVVSEDGKSVAIYVPIEAKDQSHRISTEIQKIVAGFDPGDDFHITGLPVAEDTFGVEMFTQMGVSAPLAALVIFLLLWFFFRSIPLILSPMIIAFATVLMTMGTLIGMGFTVHIMSSMIPIFLMPIAVVDSVHILSEFVDLYPKRGDRRATIAEIVRHLFAPMLYTSLTSAAGFFSLAFTPIPPVRVFGIFVASGILLAFILTIVFVPAYVVSLSDKSLQALLASSEKRREGGLLGKFIESVGRQSLRYSKLVILAAVAVVGISAYGITKVNINDNPVRWFQDGHRLRVADAVLNEHLSGTYPAFLIFEQSDEQNDALLKKGDALVKQDKANTEAVKLWENAKTAAKTKVSKHDITFTAALIEEVETLASDDAGASSELWYDLVDNLETSQSESKVFQDPQTLAYLERLQKAAEKSPHVGKTISLADVVKTVYRELKSGKDADYRIPETSNGVAQTLLQYESSHRPQDLWHMVNPELRHSAVWFQLKSGDNQDMAEVKEQMDDYLAANPPPHGLKAQWAGLTYINVVWQDKMVGGMLKSLMGSFVMVFLMMIVLFRSFIYGLLSMVPLTITILFTYGFIGFAGKDYDMPVAVLSSLTLGLSVDFAIHFLERSRDIHGEFGDWKKTMALMFKEPGRAIARNAIVIAIGFLPLLAAPLVPYKTVGVLMAAIMAVSSVVTIVVLPAIMSHLTRWLGKNPSKAANVNLSPSGVSLGTSK